MFDMICALLSRKVRDPPPHGGIPSDLPRQFSGGGETMKSFPRKIFLFASLAATCILVLGQTSALAQTNWPQWGQNPQHQGFLNVAGQSLNRTLADVVYDPFVSQEQAATGGDLLVHYQVPLLCCNDVFIELTTGQLTGLTH